VKQRQRFLQLDRAWTIRQRQRYRKYTLHYLSIYNIPLARNLCLHY
jgi:hypothetical protein